MDGAPGSNTALDRATNAVAQFGMSPDHLLENGDRADAGSRPQQRHDLGFENLPERIWPAPFPRNLPLRGQPRILLYTIGRGCADRRLRRCDGRRIGLPELHEKPQLVIGYVAAGHKSDSSPTGKTTDYPVDRNHQTTPEKERAAGGLKLQSGFSLRSNPPAFSS
ncbi:hypothetical protein [Mesorhizobium sp. M00.F.Ca.ET.217.01.1.1]|uniref:hypothetical protein n=1 Tax=Mesorhizobium sp. M00.F.Ca.ET.217.01.1.1 TaxID=2500529 RepID=UPI000FD76441|nr:hypothetical protein [Mesorhizobium sp. M00.F.Ca.ET.217.01.1.1]TGQ11369.1 hypothetical protein EN860_032355 [Mesorhizobium sp. M00.F.Ca.ET.217.01.1.1]TGV83795.1 hypothetical protein EN801_031935 [Mesorhizobium sp. M00.F.Ca.ET.158.01.1.1]